MSFIDVNPASIGSDGGRSLGSASGRITIDTSDAQNARVTMQRVGRDIAQSVKPIQTELKRVQQGIREFRGEIAGIGFAGGALSALGLGVAGSLEEAQIQLTGLVGSQEAAIELMDDLRKQAAAAGIPFADMLQVARQLLPTLEGNTEELGKWFDLVRRTATLNRQEGVTGAAFSLNEAISSGGTDLVSLAERFNISRTRLRAALEQTGGDFAAALDIVLTKMGVTTETAEQMGQTFNASLRAARDAFAQLLAEGFTPLLQQLTPVLQGMTSLLSRIRETNPAISQFGAAVAAIAAVGAPSLLLLNQMVEAAQKLKALGLLGAAGRTGAVGLGVGLGLAGSQQILQGIGGATGNEGLANIGFREMLFQATSGLTKLTSLLDRTLTDAAGLFWETVASFRTAVAQFVQWLGDKLPGSLGEGFGLLGDAAVAETQARLNEKLAELASELAQREMDRFNRLDQFMGQILPVSPAASPAATTVARPATTGGFTADQTQAIQDWADGVQQIERDAAQARLQATQQFESQRADIIASYNITIAREAEDFARSRLRQEQQLQASILSVRQDAIEREARWMADLGERIADLRGDSGERIAELREQSNKRLVQIEQDHTQRMEQLQRSHRDSLLEAASRLDARAVATEQRRFRTQVAGMESDLQKRTQAERESLQERIEQEQENLQERIAQEQKAHERRVRDAREADEERIRDMQASLREQQRLEDEDRAIRLQRMAEDHQRQLAQLARAQAERLAQISQQAQQERQRLDQEFIKRLAQLGIQNQAWLRIQAEGQKAALKSFETFWKEFEKTMRKRSPQSTTVSGGNNFAYRHGGSVDYTGLALVHGSPSRPEYVLSPETTQAVAQVLGRGFTQPKLVQALTGDRGRDVAGQQTIVPGFQIPRMQIPQLSTPLQLPVGALDAIMRMARNAVTPQINVAPAPVVAGGGGRSVSLSLSAGAIQVNGAGDAGEAARAVMDEFENLLRSMT